MGMPHPFHCPFLSFSHEAPSQSMPKPLDHDNLSVAKRASR